MPYPSIASDSLLKSGGTMTGLIAKTSTALLATPVPGAEEFFEDHAYYTTASGSRRRPANNGQIITLRAFTVATLPAGSVGETAYVTDALTPTYLGALVGGGLVHCPVFRNATAWVSG